MKHSIFAVALSAVTLAGCGKDTPAPVSTAPSPTIAAAPREVTHELDAAKHDIPAQPVSGRVAGKPFTPDRADLDGNILTFREGSPVQPHTELTVMLNKPVAADGPFRDSIRADRKEAEGIPSINYFAATSQGFKHDTIGDGYALTVELAKPENGKVAGKIYLSLPDGHHSVIAGTFTAWHDRASYEPPTAADKPYITGAIEHKGASGTPLYAGYLKLPVTDEEEAVSGLVQTDVKPDAIDAVRNAMDKPRSVTLRPNGEGKGAEYDVTKIPPGKYLVVARLEGGVASWVLQDVAADSALTVPFKLKTEGAGNVEVSIPGLKDDAVVQVQVLPESLVTALNGRYEIVAGWVLGTYVSLEKEKVIRNLPPGEYMARVRIGGGRSTAKVTVKAGETSKVELKAP